MSLIDILFNAAGGGVVGSLLHLGTSFFETWQKRKNAEVEIMLMNAKVAAAEKQSAWDAFTASQKTNDAIPIPEGAAPWVASLLGIVEALRAFTRPGLTWALLGVLSIAYFNAPEEVQSGMISELQFAAFTAIFWWLGSRYTSKK
jgi:hypothetical protein